MSSTLKNSDNFLFKTPEGSYLFLFFGIAAPSKDFRFFLGI